ncbi:MAG TPA: sugar ABC transporter ATP-binding protein [Candidatus Limnocylindrales bacterium]|nr:sugar ABC transporter ATP-binding protein [Candidatus Limnocylindrales bacterium]
MNQVNGGPVVEMTHIVKTFPGVRALDDVSFDVQAGEIHALVGKNGAGKSTLMSILTGLYPPDSGTISVRGQTVDHMTTTRSQEAGIAIVAQHARFVPGLSVAENLFMGQMPTRRGGFVDWDGLRRDASGRLRRFGLDVDVTRRMESMSVAERQMIEVARALFADASVIILDEPTAPLPKHEVSMLFDFVRRQREAGASFIYISHYLEEVFEIADRVTVLRNGSEVGTVPISELTQPELIRMISGTSVERFERPPRESVGQAVLEIHGLSRKKAYEDVHLTLHAGEVVGLTGLEGSGPGHLARGLYALEPMGKGEVTLDGKPFHPDAPSHALERGLAYLPRDRHGLGIVAIRSVRDNISMSIIGRLTRWLGMIDQARERALVNGFIQTLGIMTPSPATNVENLSGGNQQKVVVAKLAATEPRVLLLDEPTQGVDVQAKVEILRIVDELTDHGVAVAIVSDVLSELVDTCDRIVVFYRGRIAREFRKGTDEMTPATILAAIEGGAGEAAHAMA